MTMKLCTVAIAASMVGSTLAFAPAGSSSRPTTSISEMPDRLWDTMVDKTQRSEALPWLPKPKNLDGTYPGDAGFDPFYLSSIPKNFAGFIQPPQWEDMGDGISTIYWMREAEVKHARVSMLAVVGWLATDGAFGMPLRFPGEMYSVENIPTGYVAHDILVEQGSMTFLLLCVAFCEFVTSAALVQVAKGELDREAGDFGIDPLGFLKDASPEKKMDWQTREINNGRLAMLAFGGIATQTALGASDFPYF